MTRWRLARRVLGLAALVLQSACGSALAQVADTVQPADTVLVNGRVVRYDAPDAQAIAVRGDTIVAVGSVDDVQPLIGKTTRVIDLGARTVIPGLIDSHIHAIRAGLTWRTEVSWIGLPSLAQALDRIREAARTAAPGTWLVVAGGWTPRQFGEERAPTAQEIEAAAPGHRVYVQLFYSRVLLNRLGAEALGLLPAQDIGPRLAFETDTAGRPTGWITGNSLAISEIFDRLPRPTLAQRVAGTREFFRELNKVGLTGVADPGGYNLGIADYQAVMELARARRLTVRVRYSLSAPRPLQALQDLQQLTRQLPMGAGDDWLRFNGIGENVSWGMYNNEQPTGPEQQQLAQVLRWAAARGLTATFHWNNDQSVHFLLDQLERVNADLPLAGLRWSIAHLHDASQDTLRRMKALGVGWLVQNAFYFRGEAFLGQRGPDLVRSVPPIGSAIRIGLPVGAGTDAHRVMGFNPFAALQWLVDGKTLSGLAMRAPDELLSRIDALRLYTEGSAWFTFDEQRRGAIVAGRLADLAVLSADYLTVPTDEISQLRSVMTMVGGRIVFGADRFAPLQDRD